MCTIRVGTMPFHGSTAILRLVSVGNGSPINVAAGNTLGGCAPGKKGTRRTTKRDSRRLSAVSFREREISGENYRRPLLFSSSETYRRSTRVNVIGLPVRGIAEKNSLGASSAASTGVLGQTLSLISEPDGAAGYNRAGSDRNHVISVMAICLVISR